MNDVRKKIIWLEDRPALLKSTQKVIGKQYELILCKDLRTFRQTTLQYLPRHEQVAGVIVDVLLPYGDLQALELPFIKTSGGNDAGARVVEHYLLNLDDLAESRSVSASFRCKPVLILSALNSLKARFGFLDESAEVSVSFLTKGAQTDQEVEQWLTAIPG